VQHCCATLSCVTVVSFEGRPEFIVSFFHQPPREEEDDHEDAEGPAVEPTLETVEKVEENERIVLEEKARHSGK
jgi:hypothetical protein